MRLSASTTSALATPMVAHVGAAPDGLDVPPHGTDLRPAEWAVPAVVTDEMIRDCRNYLREHNRLDTPMTTGARDEEGMRRDEAGRREIARWLGALFSGCARRHADDIDETARLAAGVFALAEHPALVFTDANLRAAQRLFRFVPSAEELLAFADGIVTAAKQTASRAFRIIDAGARRARPVPRDEPAHGPWNKEIAEVYGRKLGERQLRELDELRRIVAERDAAKAAEKAAGKVPEPVAEPAPAPVVTRPPAPIAKPRPFTAAELERVRRLHPGAVPLDEATEPDTEPGAA